jgi:ribosome biogenesis protein MAK21
MVAQNGSSKAPRRRGRKGKEIETTRNGYSRVAHQADSADVLSYKPHKTLLIHLTEATPTWYECGRGSASRDDTLLSVKKGNDKKPRTNSNATVAKYRKLADSIYQQEVVLSRANSATKDEAWVENTMKRGTLKDRIAAMSVVVSTSPVHKLYALDMLLNLAGISTLESGNSSQTNERVSAMAAEALTDLFSNTLLPTHRKLVGLESRPLYQYEESQNNTTKRTISPRILLLWRYEEIIKNKYSAFLSQYLGKTLSQTSTSVESLTKINALRTACSLLKEIPEGEQLLLNLVANKVGDPTKKIASAAAHELRKILEVHPNMTTVIAREVR